jgi:hypothetical protein
MIACLIARSGPLSGSTFVLNERTLLGRSGQADVQLMEQEASRRHALILRQEDLTWWVGDLSSTNGTFVGIRRIGDHRLIAGDLLRIGKSIFEYQEVEDLSGLAQMIEEEQVKLLSGRAEESTVDVPMDRMEGVWWDSMMDAHGEGGRRVKGIAGRGETQKMIPPGRQNGVGSGDVTAMAAAE